MLSPVEFEEYCRALEDGRRARAETTGTPGGTIWPSPDDVGTGTVEIAPGRGNLDYSSGNWPSQPTALALLGNRTISFARLYMSQPWVAAAVMWLLTKAIRVPLKAYRAGSDPEDPASKVRLRAGEHPFATCIEQPWERGTTAELVQSILGPMFIHGNGTHRIDMGRTALTLTPKDWRFCRPVMPFRDTIAGFMFNVDSVAFREDVAIDRVLHTKYWSPLGPVGVSPLQQLGTTLQIEDAAQRLQRSTMANGALTASAITMTDEFLGIEPVKRENIVRQVRRDIGDLYSGPDNGGRPVLLPPGLDWKDVGMTTVEAGLIEQRKLSREEICGVYLIPPPLMGILDRATYSNIQVQREMTYTDCMGPPLIMVEQLLNAQVVREFLQVDDVFCEFDFGEVLRGDRLAEIQALREAISTALMNPNEGRSVLNLPRSKDPAMNEFYMPLVNNLAPVSGGVPAGASALAGSETPPALLPEAPRGVVLPPERRARVLEPAVASAPDD